MCRGYLDICLNKEKGASPSEILNFHKSQSMLMIEELYFKITHCESKREIYT